MCVCVYLFFLWGGGGGGGGEGLTELDLSIHAQQDVVALDVTMDYLVGVEELQCLQTLCGHQEKIKNQHSIDAHYYRAITSGRNV